MKVMPWAEFTADLQRDATASQDGSDGFQWPGKGASEALAEMLTRCGCEVSKPRCLDVSGWQLLITAGRRKVRCRVIEIDKYLIGFRDTSWLADLLHRNHPDFLQLLKCVAVELANDPRFHDVRWFAANEVQTDAVGASFPVSD
jgi:hypothetical protein